MGGWVLLNTKNDGSELLYEFDNNAAVLAQGSIKSLFCPGRWHIVTILGTLTATLTPCIRKCQRVSQSKEGLCVSEACETITFMVTCSYRIRVNR